MALNPNIILSGQSPDILGAMSKGNALAQQSIDMRNAGEMNAFLRQNGQNLLAGDPAVLAEYARFDPTGAFNAQTQNRNNARADEELALRRERYAQQDQRADQEWQLKAAEYAQGLSAEQAAQKAAELEGAVKMGLKIKTPQEWDQVMSQYAPDLVGQFDNREMLANRYLEVADILKGYEPQSAPGKVQADIDAGLIPEGTPLQSGGVTVNTGDTSPGLGKLSSDYGYVLDPTTGKPVIDPNTGLPQAAPVPGSPAAREIEAQAQKAQGASETVQRAGNVVSEDIGRVLGMLEGGRNQPITGALGWAARGVPGTEAYDAAALVETIKANIGFDRLQQMRQDSPTGGALGAVTEKELATLQAVLGNLDLSQSKEQLVQNLKRIDKIYNGILEKAAATGDGTFVPRATEQTRQSPPDFSTMSDDELSEWIANNG